MRVKRDHLRKRGKITLSIPSQDISFVESLVERFPNISFSELVLKTLKEKYGEKGFLCPLVAALRYIPGAGPKIWSAS